MIVLPITEGNPAPVGGEDRGMIIHVVCQSPCRPLNEIQVVVEADDNGAIDTQFCYTLLPHPFWSLGVVDVATGTFEDLPGDLFSYAPAWDPANDWRLVY
ncbi:MAG: hypothetical protein P8186_04930, partial [Anaerolineae bacterium]